MTFEVLGPLQDYAESNNDSTVFRLQYDGFSMLFCGDMEAQAERDLLEDGAVLRADVLKVAHHGSDTSTSAALLEAVQPRYAVISSGEDRSMLPRNAVLQRLHTAGAESSGPIRTAPSSSPQRTENLSHNRKRAVRRVRGAVRREQKMKKIVIDRFDGIYAICADKDKNFFAIELGELPQGTKAGDVLVITDDGTLEIDQEETARRRQRAQEKRAKLLGL